MRLINGECLDEMDKLIAEGVKVDAIITDPPYGTTACKWDSVIDFEAMWERLNKLIKPNGAIVLFGSEPFSSALRMSNIKNYKYDWIWKKERPTNIFQMKRRPGKVVETISVFYKRQCLFNGQKTKHLGPIRTNKVKNGKLGKLIDSSAKKLFEYKDDGTRNPIEILEFKRDILISNLHPTQKPVALMEYLIKTYTNEKETVLDFTMGSGSTGVACKNTNRNFIGIELDQTYFNISKERLS